MRSVSWQDTGVLPDSPGVAAAASALDALGGDVAVDDIAARGAGVEVGERSLVVLHAARRSAAGHGARRARGLLDLDYALCGDGRAVGVVLAVVLDLVFADLGEVHDVAGHLDVLRDDTVDLVGARGAIVDVVALVGGLERHVVRAEDLDDRARVVDVLHVTALQGVVSGLVHALVEDGVRARDVLRELPVIGVIVTLDLLVCAGDAVAVLVALVRARVALRRSGATSTSVDAELVVVEEAVGRVLPGRRSVLLSVLLVVLGSAGRVLHLLVANESENGRVAVHGGHCAGERRGVVLVSVPGLVYDSVRAAGLGHGLRERGDRGTGRDRVHGGSGNRCERAVPDRVDVFSFPAVDVVEDGHARLHVRVQFGTGGVVRADALESHVLLVLWGERALATATQVLRAHGCNAMARERSRVSRVARGAVLACIVCGPSGAVVVLVAAQVDLRLDVVVELELDAVEVDVVGLAEAVRAGAILDVVVNGLVASAKRVDFVGLGVVSLVPVAAVDLVPGRERLVAVVLHVVCGVHRVGDGDAEVVRPRGLVRTRDVAGRGRVRGAVAPVRLLAHSQGVRRVHVHISDTAVVFVARLDAELGDLARAHLLKVS